MLTLISIIIGALFGLVGLSIGKNIKSDSPLSDQEIISSFFKSPRNKYFYSTIILFFILLYFFGRQTNPFISNGVCIDDLRNDEECIQYLQGQWYFRKGGSYSGDEYKVTVEGEKINFKCKYSGEDDWRTMGEGEIGFDEVVENYWCCTRSVRCIHINGSSSFLYLTQSVNNGDQCGGFAFDGYSGKDIVGDEDFFVKIE
jgi:hypothetical protein